MTPIRLVPLASGDLFDFALLDGLAAGLARVLQVSCTVEPRVRSAGATFDPQRRQHHSTMLLAALAAEARAGEERVLGVTPLDLFVPILTFVYGEAQLGGPAAIVSWARLDERFYGLPPRPDVLAGRLLKEALHELGHTCGLRHCLEYSCAMASSHSIELLDLKEESYCSACRPIVLKPG